MSYELLQPPFTLDFRTMPPAELRRYYDWFMRVLPSRISQLEEAVHGSADFGSWRADWSTASLDRLGDWFATQVETRPRTHAEITKIRQNARVPIEVPSDELTDRTISLAVDIAMYFGEVLRRNASDLRWQHDLEDKRNANYGQPVLVGRAPTPLNPVRITTNLAYALADHSQTGNRLSALYRIWAANLRANQAADGT